MPGTTCLTAADSLEKSSTHPRKSSFAWGILALAFICFASYGNTLGGYFYCDDFSFMQFVHSVREFGPGILWTMFATPVSQIQPLLDCYRPLPDVVFLLGYLVSGGANAAWFHFVNVVCHWLCSVFVFLFGQQLFKAQVSESKLIAFAGAAVYASYPLSGEVITGPTNIVTSLCALFFFATLWAFGAWRESGKKLLFAATMVFFACSILSKEMGAVLPAVLFLYHFLSNKSGVLARRALEALRVTAPFWVVLTIYLTVRTLVLGPTIGGYRGSLGDGIVDSLLWRLLSPWVQAAMFPINNLVVPDARPIYVAILALYSTAVVLAVKKMLGTRPTGTSQSTILLLFCSFAALLPVLPVWDFEPALAGGRHFYVACAPLWLLAAYFTYTSKQKRMWCGVWGTLIAIFTYLNYYNNTAVIDASHEAQALNRAIQAEFSRMPANQSLLLIGAPYKHKGIYVCPSSNMLRALFSPPLMPTDLNPRIALLEPWFNMNYDLFGIDRLQALSESPDHKIVVWSSKHQKLEPFVPDFGTGDMEMAVSPISTHKDQDFRLSIERFYCEPEQLAHEVGFVECTLVCKRLPGVPSDTHAAVSLWWQNQGDPGISEENVMWLPVTDDGLPHVYRFPVCASMKWLASHHTGRFEVRMPSPNFENSLQVKLMGWRHFAPSISVSTSSGTQKRFVGPGMSWDSDANDGVIVLQNRACKVSYDARKIKDAATVVLDVSRGDGLLEIGVAEGKRNYKATRAAHSISSPQLNGSIQLRAEHFPKPGVYEIEVGTLNARGEVGYFSDPIFVRAL